MSMISLPQTGSFQMPRRPRVKKHHSSTTISVLLPLTALHTLLNKLVPLVLLAPLGLLVSLVYVVTCRLFASSMTLATPLQDS